MSATPDPSPRAHTSSPARARPPDAYAGYVLAVLFVVYVFNFADRQVLSILIEPIKADLGVSDTWMGLLAGPTFALFYTLLGVPIARLADTRSRRNLIAFSLCLWSLATAASGVARSFAHLALARVGVGVGEAGGTPPSHSLLSDYFPPERRATALALYGNGIYVGSGLGILAGGFLELWFGDWRTAFLAVGFAGVPLAVLVLLTVRDLPRGSSDPVAAAPAAQGGFLAALRFLFSRRSFVWLVVGACPGAIAGYAILTWGAVFLGRVHGMDRAAIGGLFGPMIIVGGCLGVSVGGWLADRLGRGDARWYMRLPALYALAALPFALGFLLAESTAVAIPLFVVFYTLANMHVGPLWSTTQNLAQPHMRATASAILLFILNLVGLGLGPFLIGVANDLLAERFGELAVRYSLLGVVVLAAAASGPFWLAARTLREDLRAA